MVSGELKNRLAQTISEKNLIENCDMRRYTSFKAGGKADLLVLPEDERELQYALALLAQSGVPYMVMGNGSNILVRDNGYRGVIIKLGEAFGSISIEGDRLTAGSGALMSVVAQAAMKNSLAGFEFASGIPGSIGGAVFMNAGAYGGEMKDIIEEAACISKDGGQKSVRPAAQLDLSYRHSVFHDSGDIVTSVTLRLSAGEKEKIKEAMKDLSARRNEKQPVSYPSAGSFFKRPEGYFAGKLIQDAGMKGLSVGGAQVSSLHSGFIINTGDATAADIIQLMELVRAAVLDQFGVKLEPEVRIIGE